VYLGNGREHTFKMTMRTENIAEKICKMAFKETDGAVINIWT
jgi:hypothetical protein